MCVEIVLALRASFGLVIGSLLGVPIIVEWANGNPWSLGLARGPTYCYSDPYLFMHVTYDEASEGIVLHCTVLYSDCFVVFNHIDPQNTAIASD